MSANYDEPREAIAELIVRERGDVHASWIERARSADHKVIGTTLIGFSLIALVLGGVTELLTWIQLSLPDNTFLPPERFYRLHTLSDTSYLYLFGLPLMAGLAIFVLPLQIGARSTAFPRLSALGTWLIVFGGVALYGSLFVNTWEGGVNVSTPLASLYHSPGAGVDFWLSAILMVGAGLTAIAVDLAVTFKNMRAPAMTADRVPIFAHSAAIFAYGVLVTAPVLVAACLTLLVERQYEIFGIFDTVDGGNALLWKALFQWFAHSAPYLITVVAAGIVTEVLAVAVGAPVANRSAVKRSLAALAAIGILGVGQVFYGSPISDVWSYLFMIAGLAIVVPAVVLIVSWIQTVAAGPLKTTASALAAIIYVPVFTFGMVCSAALALPTLGQWLYGSEFGYALWATLVVGTAGLGGLAGLLHWFPKITGRSISQGSAKAGVILLALGSTVTLLCMTSLGVDGFPRELSEYADSSGFQVRNVEAGIGALIASIGLTVILLNLIRSSANGAPSGNDPWHAGTLEWFVPSPPPVNNFDLIPEVVSAAPLNDLRGRIAAGTGELEGSVAQSPTSGRPSLRGNKH